MNLLHRQNIPNAPDNKLVNQDMKDITKLFLKNCSTAILKPETLFDETITRLLQKGKKLRTWVPVSAALLEHIFLKLVEPLNPFKKTFDSKTSNSSSK